MEDYDGAQVLDADGNAVGTVDRTYVDDGGTAQMVDVKIGNLFARHRLVPVDQAQVTDDGLQVPYIKDVIEESPDVSSGDTVEADVLDRVRSYYAGDYAEDGDASDEGAATPVAEADADSDGNGQSVGQKLQAAADRVRGSLPGQDRDEDTSDTPSTQIRDLGDVIEVPIVEEVMVKKPVVKEVLRIRKRDLVDQQTVSGEVRREQVEVASEGDVPGNTEVDDAES